MAKRDQARRTHLAPGVSPSPLGWWVFLALENPNDLSWLLPKWFTLHWFLMLCVCIDAGKSLRSDHFESCVSIGVHFKMEDPKENSQVNFFWSSRSQGAGTKKTVILSGEAMKEMQKQVKANKDERRLTVKPNQNLTSPFKVTNRLPQEVPFVSLCTYEVAALLRINRDLQGKAPWEILPGAYLIVCIHLHQSILQNVVPGQC